MSIGDMKALERAREDFYRAIRSSEVYVRFERVKKALEGQEEKKQIIDAFRERAYRLSDSSEPLDHMNEISELFVTRRQIRKDPLIDEYLTAEHEYCRMIQQICNDLIMLSDVQIDAFEERIRVTQE